MVQLEPNLTLTLKYLAPCGAVLSAEQQVRFEGHVFLRYAFTCAACAGTAPHLAECPCRGTECGLGPPTMRMQAALDHSLPIKKVEAGLKTLSLWGRITTLNGKVTFFAQNAKART